MRVERALVDQRADQRAVGSSGSPIGTLRVRAWRAARRASSATDCVRRSAGAGWCSAGRRCRRRRKRCARTARSRSADGATITALLPPSSSSDRPKRAATRWPTARPIARRAGGARRAARRGSSTSVLADVARRRPRPGCRSAGAPTSAAARSQQMRWHGERGERRLLGRLPDHRVAADQRERRVPRPDRDREVERGDDADGAERMPRLHHAGGPAARRRSSGRRAGATGRRRSRRCRSSPAPRRAPPSGSCPPRA